MGHSSLLGTEQAPLRPEGTDERALGPSDNSDSGSDTIGAHDLPGADPGEPVDLTLSRDLAVAPIEGTGEDSGETEATDIGTDRIVDSPDEDASVSADEDDALEVDDRDTDPAA